jgi:hypothetical protein
MIAQARCDDGLWLVEIGEGIEDDAVAGQDPEGTLERPRPVELVPEVVSALLRDVDA